MGLHMAENRQRLTCRIKMRKLMNDYATIDTDEADTEM